MMFVRRLAVVAVIALSPIGDTLAAMVTSAPPAEVRAASVVRKAAVTLAAPTVTPRRIVLAEPSDAEKRVVQQKNAGLARDAGSGKLALKHRPLAIGFARDVPARERAIALSRLEWQEAADGARVARIEVTSPGAAGLRLALAIRDGDPDLSIRFAGSVAGAAVHGPLPANAIAEAVSRFGQFVTPVLEGDTAIVELHAADGAAIAATEIVVATASHLVVAGDALREANAKDVSGIGQSGACNIDLACVAPSSALSRIGDGVGKLVFNDRSGATYACSGTLLNDSVSSQTPYLFSAAHCFEDAFHASTLDVYWFFKAPTCGSRQTPPYLQQTGGAMLLARSDDFDWALLRLNRSPPAGTWLAAWRAEPIPQLAVGTALHHPQADLLKFSQGSTLGYQVFSDGSSFVRMQWSQGTTEVGSSGSGLLTFLPDANYYELRGGLFGGEASCSNQAGVDWYSRLDTMLPLVRQYLTPDADNPAGQAVVVEFYHRSLDHYFITIDPNEINLLDTGVLRGWERTGTRFLAYAAQAPGANPTCRFYLRPEVGDSHFYSADPAECERVRRQYADAWIFESAAVFHIALPDTVTGACAAGTRPVWRFFNSRTTNHRYTTEVTIRDRLRSAPEWIPEGYGADAVIMCAVVADP